MSETCREAEFKANPYCEIHSTEKNEGSYLVACEVVFAALRTTCEEQYRILGEQSRITLEVVTRKNELEAQLEQAKITLRVLEARYRRVLSAIDEGLSLDDDRLAAQTVENIYKNIRTLTEKRNA